MRRRGTTALVASLSLFALAVAFWAPAGTAKQPTCSITNGGTEYATLQAAVDGAADGDTLFVRGVCLGNTYIAKSLTITGVLDKDFQKPTLNGGGTDRVLEIDWVGTADVVTVTINSLTIQGGSTSGYGGGIYIHGQWTVLVPKVTLNDSVVRGNTAGSGGGIAMMGNQSGQHLDLNNTTVSGNSAVGCGVGCGGGGGALYLTGSETTTLTDSFVTENHARVGGAVYNWGSSVGSFAILDLHGTTKVTSNDAAEQGGGIYNRGFPGRTSGNVTLYDDAKIAGNTATEGAGVYNAVAGNVSLVGDNVRISRNQALTLGGGIYNAGSTYNCVAGMNVRDNSPDDIYTPSS